MKRHRPQAVQEQDAPARLPWLIAGQGPHSCGRYLACRLHTEIRRCCARAIVAAALLIGALVQTAVAAQVVIDGPAGSGQFGALVSVLPNGNIVVVDPSFDPPGPQFDVGAVYLYRPDGSLISVLRGTAQGDRVGAGGVTLLSNGNYVVASPFWDNGGIRDAGAVTFGSATSGIEGVISAANSLVGSQTDDRVGSFETISSVTALGNGNYVVSSRNWDNGSVIAAGAVTFGSGVAGISGAVSASNSLVGSTAFDSIGRVTALDNGNYVVCSSNWDNGAVVDAGAVTFASGVGGITGVASTANSLVGSAPDDMVCGAGVTALSNGNYVVASPRWDNASIVNAGAITFGSGVSGIAGVVSAGNSLVGSTNGDALGDCNYRITALSNGNFVVCSPNWNNGAASAAGAVTFGSGVHGLTGTVSAANSLVGGAVNDLVGNTGITALSNGNYVVASPFWDNGNVSNVGAATFGSGETGVAGLVSANNSLIGSSPDDSVGYSGSTALANGNYVVSSPSWDRGAVSNVGAVTFADGVGGITGIVSTANSLVGSLPDDAIGVGGVTALSNGNYVVASPQWDNDSVSNAGAATFASGAGGITGFVSASNSLIGSQFEDAVGSFGVTALSNGNYVVASPAWDDGIISDAGAVTFGFGAGGLTGPVSASNSIVGSRNGDSVGAFVTNSGITPLSNGNYVVNSARWANGVVINAGAITLGLADGSVTGPISSTHSVLGQVANAGFQQVSAYDPLRNQLVVGQRESNRIVLHRTGLATETNIIGDTPDPSAQGQAVTFTASVSASTAPTNGQVTFRASSGESCVDASPTVNSTTTAEFSCSMHFEEAGISMVVAEYTGSVVHAYSGSAPEPHSTTVAITFADGFESPK